MNIQEWKQTKINVWTNEAEDKVVFIDLEQIYKYGGAKYGLPKQQLVIAKCIP